MGHPSIEVGSNKSVNLLQPISISISEYVCFMKTTKIKLIAHMFTDHFYYAKSDGGMYA